MALPAQIGVVTLVARLEQMVLAAEPGLATPGTWRAYIEPVNAFQVSLPPTNVALAPRIVFGPGLPVSFGFNTVTGELVAPDGSVGVELPVVLWSPSTDGQGNPITVAAPGQDWVLTLIQDDSTVANDSDDPTDGPYETPRVWGTWLFSLGYADAGQTRDLALIGIAAPTEAQTSQFLVQVNSALAAYFANHPAPPSPDFIALANQVHEDANLVREYRDEGRIVVGPTNTLDGDRGMWVDLTDPENPTIWIEDGINP